MTKRAVLRLLCSAELGTSQVLRAKLLQCGTNLLSDGSPNKTSQIICITLPPSHPQHRKLQQLSPSLPQLVTGDDNPSIMGCEKMDVCISSVPINLTTLHADLSSQRFSHLSHKLPKLPWLLLDLLRQHVTNSNTCGKFIVLQPPSRNNNLEHSGLPRMVLRAHPQIVLQDKVPRAVLSLKQRLFLAALSEQFSLP